MNFVEEMKAKARDYQNSLVLPEGTEERTVAAAAKIVEEKLAKSVTLLGVKSEVEKVAAEKGVSLDGIDIINPAESPWLDDFGKEYYELRKDKINKKTGQPEVTPESAREYILKDPLSFGAMMVRKGMADAMVSGALSATADLLRAGLKIIKTAPGTSTASSCFVMDTHDPKWGKDGYLIFADCAVNPNPNSEQLADIAVDSAKSCRDLLGAEPAVSMLSFSSKGSGGKLEDVIKVQEAVRLAHEKAPDLLLDGELQADASLIPEVTAKKAPGSPITGKVNTLIFPSLEAGNIGYKLVQRFAGADAYGPILQGFAKPISDLSRGCTSDEIVVTSAITLVQAGKKN
ncbi:MAG: phosphate acetyltransferase [Treponema sp.]|nr:phosphate acetyltransferase [Treponema sp.]MBQ2600777.1 phosphate acetyltransferase [Treponema sp.]